MCARVPSVLWCRSRASEQNLLTVEAFDDGGVLLQTCQVGLNFASEEEARRFRTAIIDLLNRRQRRSGTSGTSSRITDAFLTRFCPSACVS